MVALISITKKDGIFLGVDGVIGATDLAILGFLRKQFSRQANFRPPKFSDAQLLELSAYAERVPFWRDNEAAQKLIRSLRADPDFLASEVPAIPGAVKGIQALASNVPILGYIVERPALLVEATRAFLDRFDLPRAEIFTPPPESEIALDRRNWKSGFFRSTLAEPKGILDSDGTIISELNDGTILEGEVFLLRPEGQKLKSRFPSQAEATPPFVTITTGWKEAVKKIREWFG